jgi:hypothetical protein
MEKEKLKGFFSFEDAKEFNPVPLSCIDYHSTKIELHHHVSIILHPKYFIQPVFNAP